MTDLLLSAFLQSLQEGRYAKIPPVAQLDPPGPGMGQEGSTARVKLGSLTPASRQQRRRREGNEPARDRSNTSWKHLPGRRENVCLSCELL